MRTFIAEVIRLVTSGGRKNAEHGSRTSLAYLKIVHYTGKKTGRREIATLVRKNPPFADGAKDGPPSSIWVGDLTQETQDGGV